MSAESRPSARPAAARVPAAGRADAARHLLRSHQIRESLALARQASPRNALLAGGQAALTMAVALPLAYVSAWPHMVGFASLGALVALFGRFAPPARRGRVVALCALCQCLAVLIMSTVVWLGAPLPVQLALLALLCGLFFLATVSWQFGPPGALIFAFAAGASMGPVDAGWQIVERTAATALVAGLAWLVCASTEIVRRQATPEAPFPVEPARPLDHRLIAAARIAIGSAIAAFAADAMGAAHPAWAAMGTLAVMQGSHLHISMNRALQRMGGTLIGAALVWLIMLQAPSVWTVIALLVVLQIVTEMVIGTNYAFGQITVTPMALLMSYLASPSAAGAGMASERVLDTLIGISIGIVLAVLCSTLDDRVHLAHHHAARARRPEEG
ncbi:Uncharacterised protein [Starkeya nomas]|uniref:Integral membrane bound transporter domain-containing protein n=1 Tax=Starkeya nomas TaxID=2666134 RepID=A0A5S9PAS0_9HYPH|nr:FUSC family protein [Starkeya nomas]CAA0100821.1 Uncharacterised protein [Starkeya nomas]